MPVCPHCACDDVKKNGINGAGNPKWKCRSCCRQFTEGGRKAGRPRVINIPQNNRVPASKSITEPVTPNRVLEENNRVPEINNRVLLEDNRVPNNRVPEPVTQAIPTQHPITRGASPGFSTNGYGHGNYPPLDPREGRRQPMHKPAGEIKIPEPEGPRILRRPPPVTWDVPNWLSDSQFLFYAAWVHSPACTNPDSSSAFDKWREELGVEGVDFIWE